MQESLPQDYLPVLIQLGAALIVVCIILTLSVLLGPRLKGGAKDDPFL
jgi:NADH:ubiquinone oxidoreductase subunit 3 (subunit A)